LSPELENGFRFGKHVLFDGWGEPLGHVERWSESLAAVEVKWSDVALALDDVEKVNGGRELGVERSLVDDYSYRGEPAFLRMRWLVVGKFRGF